jgi:hypothetical protein
VLPQCQNIALYARLKNEFSSNLKPPIVTVQELDNAETPATDISIGIAEVRRVQCVEQFQPGLQLQSVTGRELFEQ